MRVLKDNMEKSDRERNVLKNNMEQSEAKVDY